MGTRRRGIWTGALPPVGQRHVFRVQVLILNLTSSFLTCRVVFPIGGGKPLRVADLPVVDAVEVHDGVWKTYSLLYNV